MITSRELDILKTRPIPDKFFRISSGQSTHAGFCLGLRTVFGYPDVSIERPDVVADIAAGVLSTVVV
jgi:hypothetical protein